MPEGFCCHSRRLLSMFFCPNLCLNLFIRNAWLVFGVLSSGLVYDIIASAKARSYHYWRLIVTVLRICLLTSSFMISRCSFSSPRLRAHSSIPLARLVSWGRGCCRNGVADLLTLFIVLVPLLAFLELVIPADDLLGFAHLNCYPIPHSPSVTARFNRDSFSFFFFF